MFKCGSLSPETGIQVYVINFSLNMVDKTDPPPQYKPFVSKSHRQWKPKRLAKVRMRTRPGKATGRELEDCWRAAETNL